MREEWRLVFNTSERGNGRDAVRRMNERAQHFYDTNRGFVDVYSVGGPLDDDQLYIEFIEDIFGPMTFIEAQAFLESRQTQEDVDAVNAAGFLSDGSRLAARRRLSNMTQKQLADASKVKIQTIQSYEACEKDLSKEPKETIEKLAAALHCAVNELISQ